jgi:hypothetical protein
VYLFVDGYGGDVGEFTLSMTSQPGCAVNADCASLAATPVCDPVDFVCVGCVSSFDCTDPTKPACGYKNGKVVCQSFDVCTNDDADEPNSDGPSGAFDLTPAGSPEGVMHSALICDAPIGPIVNGDVVETELDWYKFSVADGNSVTLTLGWTNNSVDLDMFVLDAAGALGQSLWQHPEVVNLTYLPAGTYYAAIRKFRTGSASPTPVAYDITASVTTSGGCGTDFDCAASYGTQILRGHCNTTTTACEPISNAPPAARTTPCDSADDCDSGYCSYLYFTENQSQYGYCTVACGSDAECNIGEYCNTVLSAPICTHYCSVDDECPVDFSVPPPVGAAWKHLTCDTTNPGGGKCTY